MDMLKLPREQKMQLVKNVQGYFEEERSETLGDLAAEQFVDFMIKELGPYIYNTAIEDAKKLITEKLLQIDDEFYTLEKPLYNRKR
ncbi:DUF2164 domain-containing protein [Cohnella pontilimi]|uniref:DUF2164 domain-containing protein n=1 Tax=Cohnella pontilimi TaxID=2564100 RepID=A0A4U0FHG4_9BACL|nr:DUF2164 domain-containing protein [Cohnella pontilimi]TJY43864.1 DUF2164 domain-containing protein [Cohnella pontilimi]